MSSNDGARKMKSYIFDAVSSMVILKNGANFRKIYTGNIFMVLFICPFYLSLLTFYRGKAKNSRYEVTGVRQDKK